MLNCIIYKTVIIQQSTQFIEIKTDSKYNSILGMELKNLFLNNYDYQSIFTFLLNYQSLELHDIVLDYVAKQTP